MFVRRNFYRSVYLTLGVACACLGYAELSFLPEMSFLSGVVALLLLVAYRLEGRWALSLRAANILGGIIGIGAIGWVAFQFVRPWGGTLLDQLPWPTSLLPYLGPLLMILIPAKLFRPKHDGDVWGLHGIGLIAVALACALAGDPIFGGLLVAYLICLMWSLTLFYYYREQKGAAGPAAANADVPRPFTRLRWSEPPRALGQSGRWAGAVIAMAVLVFLATPRSGDARWQLTLSGGRLQAGYAEDRPGIDLNHMGTVSLNQEVVFTVYVFDGNSHPRSMLDPNIRWRGSTFNYYEGGRWEDRPIAEERVRGLSLSAGPPATTWAQPSYLGPNQIVLRYAPHNRVANPNVLAEPVWHSYPRDRHVRSVPAVSVFDPKPGERRQRQIQLFWTMSSEYELRPPTPPVGAQRLSHYVQVMLPPDEPGLGPPVNPMQFYLDPLRDFASVPKLKTWTAQLVQELATRKRVPPDVLGPDGVRPEHYEAVARALSDYLANSGEFKYTLTLQRLDPNVDPVEDFLRLTRRGHCNRFATALTLMLRSQGIPSRIVLGYRGADEVGEGKYEVRSAFAHAWVEAMIPRTQPDGEQAWHWLTLDPTPSTEDTEVAEFEWGRWWDETRVALAGMFKHFIVEYDADQQDRTRSSIGDSVLGTLNRGWGWVRYPTGGGSIAVVAVFACVLSLLFWRRRSGPRAAVDHAGAVIERLLSAIGRLLGGQAPGRTPRELAEEASGRLRAAPSTSAFADLPLVAVNWYYRARYGAQPLDPDERRELADRLEQLERALPAAPNPG
jgi:transglutaminase-like putative cysteine protease